MVRNLTLSQWTASFSLSNQPMFVYVTTNVCEWMSQHFHQDIAMLGDRSAALPIWVTFASLE